MEENERNKRTRALLGDEAALALSEKSAAVFGLGGVGSACAEALARSGIGTLALVDFDTIEPSNLNRQLLATVDTLGMKKTEVMRERVLQVSPETRAVCFDVRYSPETADEIDLSAYDYVLDCVDSVKAKVELAKRCQESDIPELSCMGVGNRLDPLLLCVGDIKDAVNDPLAAAVRKALRRAGIESLRVLYSDEIPISVPGGVIGSVPFVPPAAGLAMAGYAVRDLLDLRARQPGKRRQNCC